MAISRKDIVNTKERTREAEYTSETLARSKVYRAKEPVEEQPTPVVEKRQRSNSAQYTYKKKSGGSGKWFLVVLVLLILGGIAYGAGVVFENAKVVVNQKHQVFTLDHQQFTASKDPATPLHFEIMIVPDTQYKDMVLTESANVSSKATGTLAFYNEYSTKAVSIGAHTYVADSAGKTYLTDKALTIPGYTVDKVDKTKIIPGTASMTVTAFLSGDSYNSSSTDFTIAAYKNTTKFKKIYAKAKTPLTGGAQGLIYTLNAEQKGQLETEIASTFKDNLMKKVVAQVPAGYVLYDHAPQFVSNLDETFSSPTPNAKVPLDGTITAVIFKKSDVTNALVQRLLPDISDKEAAEIQLKDADNLSFGFLQNGQIINKDTTTIVFTLTGDLHADWTPDVTTLKTNLVGVPSTSVTSIFQTDPGITSAHVSIFPPWQSHLPVDPAKIHILVQ